MLHPAILYPNLDEDHAATHFDLLAGIIDERIIPSDRHDGEYVFDRERLAEDETLLAYAVFDYELYNLVDEGLVAVDDHGVPHATDEGRDWFEQMQADLEAVIAIDEGRVYLVRTDVVRCGYLHAYDKTEDDEFDTSGGVDLTPVREHGVIDWDGDMVPFITKLGGRFLATYRPELFESQSEPIAA